MFEMFTKVISVLSSLILLMVVVDGIKTKRKLDELEERIEELENK